MNAAQFSGVFLIAGAVLGCSSSTENPALNFGGGAAGAAGAAGANPGPVGVGGAAGGSTGGAAGLGSGGSAGSAESGGAAGASGAGGGAVGGAGGSASSGGGGSAGASAGGTAGAGGNEQTSPGELVASYGQNGFVLGDVAPGFGATWDVRDASIDAAGRVVLAGVKVTGSIRDFMAVRYEPTGSISFSATDDIGGHGDEADAVAVTGAGKMVLAGRAETGVSAHIGLVRYRADGAIDKTFDVDGKVMTQVGWSSRAWDVVANDDEIVVAGETAPLSGERDFCVVRYDATGKPKTSFDFDGVASVDFGSDDRALALAVQADGRVVVAGSVGSDEIGVARLNADGSLDKTFGAKHDGTVRWVAGNGVTPRAVATSPNGRIVVAAALGKDFFAIALSANGALDLGFNSDGKAVFDYSANDEPRSVLIDASGDVLIGGAALGGTPSNSHAALLRLSPSGMPDLAFGVGGLALHAKSPTNGERALAVRAVADGYLVAGTQAVSGGVRMLSMKVAR